MSGVSDQHPHDDLAVYALDALDGDGRTALEAHVARCGACRAELADHRRTLALVVHEEAPPPGAWDAIVRRVRASTNGHGRLPVRPTPADLRTVPELFGGGRGDTSAPGSFVRVGPVAPGPPRNGTPLDGVSGSGPPGPAPRRGVAPAPAGPAASGGSAGGPPAPAAAAGRWPSRRRGSGRTGPARRAGAARRGALVGLGAAATVAVALGLAGVRVGGGSGDPTVAEQAAAALDDPDTTVVALASTMDGDPAARYVVDGSDAYVVVDDLAPLDDARTYQLWELGDGGPTSLGVLGPGVEVVAVERATGGGDLAISEEPAGGSASPTGAVVAGGLDAG